MSTIASYLPLNMSETVRDRGLVPKDHQFPLGNSSSRLRDVIGHATTW